MIDERLKTGTTVGFLELLEQLYNPEFKEVEFDSFLYNGDNIGE